MSLNGKKALFVLLIILATAAFLRLFEFRTFPPGLYPDEAMNGNNAIEALSTHQFKVFYPENNGREGLFMNIQALFLAALKQNEPWALRLPSAIFGIFTVLGIYFLATVLFKNKNLGLLSAFLTAVSFWHVNFSRIGFRAIMAPFFLIWTLYFLLKSFNKSDSKFYFLNSIFSGLFFGLGFYSYIAYRPLPLLVLIVILLYWFRNKDRAIRKKILMASACFIAVTFFTALPLGLYFLHNPADFFGRTSEISVFSSQTPLKDLVTNILKTAGMFNVVGDGNWRHNIAGAPELFWPVGILFVIGAILGVGRLLKISKSKYQISNNDQNSKSFKNWNLFGAWNLGFGILFAWLIIAALPVVVSNESIPHALRSILMIPPVFMLAAVGGIWLYEKIKTKISGFKTEVKNLKVLNSIFGFLIFVFFVWLTANTYYSYFIYWGQNQNTKDAFAENYVQIGRALNALPQSMPKYVFVQASGVPVNGIPTPAQTVMFITNTYLPQNQAAKNIHYILPDQIGQIPPNAFVVMLN